MGTARHPQTRGDRAERAAPDHRARRTPRLAVPMKLAVKNIKAISKLEYTVKEPPDDWSDFRRTDQARGYSKYDGL